MGLSILTRGGFVHFGYKTNFKRYSSTLFQTQVASKSSNQFVNFPRCVVLKQSFGKFKLEKKSLFSTFNSSRNVDLEPIETVNLANDTYVPQNHDPNSAPIIIIHGVLGNRRNWATSSKIISDTTNLSNIRIDLRDHGDSPHTSTFTQEILVEDVVAFAKKKGLTKINLLGHSLGGKVAMRTALEYPDLVKSLIVVDIAPVTSVISNFVDDVLDIMFDVDSEGKKSSFKELKTIIDNKIPSNPVLRDFILSCTTKQSLNPASNFKANIVNLRIHLDEIWKFLPLENSQTLSYKGLSLFVYGSKSEFNVINYLKEIYAFFPNYEIKSVDSGHFVQAENPTEFIKIVTSFYKALKNSPLN